MSAAHPVTGLPVGSGAGRSALGWPVLLGVFVRSFVIQGSWNERTMQGGGFGFALMPALRALHGSDPAALDAALRRHVEHFNAHPYLADLALGAVLRMEVEGASGEEIRRFKSALRGPLGSLGDSLVWAAWLPACSLFALAGAMLGLGAWGVLTLFLVLYNTGHLLLRAWVFQAGYREGREVARWLREAHLGRHSTTVAQVGTVLLGLVLGLGVAVGVAGTSIPWPGVLVGTLLMGAGALRGLELRRPAWLTFTIVTFFVLLAGVLR